MELVRKRVWLYRVAVAGLVAVLLVPVALVQIPPIVDYPNHLARIVVLAAGASDPFLSNIYAIHWDAIPNIGMDAVMPPMLAAMSIYTAGRVMLAVAIVLPVFGTIAYSRAVLGVRSYWPLASGLVAYNAVLLYGFMNFLISVGLALLAAAAWIRWRDRYPVTTTVAMVLVASIVFFAHLFGVLLLGLLIFCHEATVLVSEATNGRLQLRQAIVRLSMAGIIFLPAAALYTRSLAGLEGAGTDRYPFDQTLFELFAPFLLYYRRADIALALLIVGIMVACAAIRKGLFVPETILALGLLLVLYFSVPSVVDGSHLTIRLSTMAGFLLFAGFTPRALDPRISRTICIVLCIFVVGRVALVSQAWVGQNHDLAELRQVIAAIPPHSRVLATGLRRSDNVAYWNAMPRRRFVLESIPTIDHLPALVLIERDSFWPLLFARPRRQPITVREAWADLAGTGSLPGYHVLATDFPDRVETDKWSFLPNWPAKYDYVLVLLSGGAQDLERVRPDRLELVTRNDMAALFRVRGSNALR
ncbi:MAG: hypothetical protein U1E70_23275 [Acetobacteraceae bacterium]|nr:hypothetical protein [Pseudomonadota bacterium]